MRECIGEYYRGLLKGILRVLSMAHIPSFRLNPLCYACWMAGHHVLFSAAGSASMLHMRSRFMVVDEVI